MADSILKIQSEKSKFVPTLISLRGIADLWHDQDGINHVEKTIEREFVCEDAKLVMEKAKQPLSRFFVKTSLSKLWTPDGRFWGTTERASKARLVTP